MKTYLLRIALILAIATGVTAFIIPEDDQVLIGLSMGDVGQARWQKDQRYIEQTVTGMGGKVLTKIANQSAKEQAEQIRTLISQGVSVLIVVPFDGRKLEKVLGEARDQGVKVLAYDRLVMDADVDYYVSYDNYKVGQLQAQFMADKRKKGEFVLIQGPASDNNSSMLYRGQADVLRKETKMRVLKRYQLKSWSGQEGEDVMSEYLASHRVPAGVIAPNDDVARGVIRALSDVDGTENVIITGQDADLASCKQIVAGRQSMTVYKPIKPLAFEAAFTAIRMANKEPVFNVNDSLFNGRSSVPSVILTPFAVDAVNISNVIDDGHFSRQDLYGN